MPERFDVVIAGSGIGGLTAAARLAARGLRTLLLERQGALGGYAGSFRRGEYRFDSAASFLGAAHGDGEVAQLLRDIGADGAIRFARVNRNLRLLLPDRELDTRALPVDETIAAAFPQQRDAMARFQKIVDRVGADLDRFGRMPRWQQPLMPLLCPHLFRHARSRLGDLLDRTIDDPALRTVASYIPATAPPREVSLLFAAAVLSKAGHGGLCYPEGGVGALVETLADAARRHGAEVRTQEALEAIEHDGRRVRAVRTSSGECIETRAVVIGFNPADALGRLEGPESRRIAGARARTKRFRPSASAFIVYLGLDPAVDWSNEFFLTTLFETNDLDRVYRTIARGEMPDETIFHVTFPGASGAIESGARPTAKIVTAMPYEPFAKWRAEGEDVYRRRKEELADPLIDRVARRIPSLRGRIVLRETATPLTLERWTSNPRGAMYGLEPTPDQFGPWRWPNKAALGGLFFCGHFSHPSHGIVGTCYSGRFAAEAAARFLK